MTAGSHRFPVVVMRTEAQRRCVTAAVERARLADFDVTMFDITDEELEVARADRLIGLRVVGPPSAG